MPSFDIVSEVNKVELKNAVDQANKEIANRFDFKGSDARVEQAELVLTLYADDEEIIGENVAAAVSYAGAMLAIAIIVGHAAEGEFEGWGPSLRAYFVALASSLALYPTRQLVVQTLMLRQPFSLRGGALDRLIAQDRNVGASAVEAVSYVAAALLLTGVA